MHDFTIATSVALACAARMTKVKRRKTERRNARLVCSRHLASNFLHSKNRDFLSYLCPKMHPKPL